MEYSWNDYTPINLFCVYSNLERERERENKRRKQENLAPLNDGGVGSSSSSLGFSPRYAISWLDIFSFFILLLLFYFFTPGFWWSDSRVHRFLKDAWSTSWINQGPSTKDFVFPSCSIKDRCSGCLVFQQQAYFIFSACVLLGTNHHLKTPVGFGLDWNCFFSFFRWGVVGYSDRSNRSIIFPWTLI